MAIVELRNVTKLYPGGVRAVDNVSLSVNEGEIVALLGPSGCGKSTTLRLIAGFETPDEGVVVLNGREVAGNGRHVPPEQRKVGMVFQDYPLFPHRTILQNVAFGLHKLPKQEAARRASEALALVGLESVASRHPHQLSGGQQQRVALAQALAPRPGLILLDEPFSNLDAALREELRLLVRDVIRRVNATALIVTHDQKEAFTVADRVAVMSEGRVEQVGAPYELYCKPSTAFVARFLGHCALLDGVVQHDGPGILTQLGLVKCLDCPAASGERVKVSLRPDSLMLDPKGPIEAEVESVVHEGYSVELFVRISGEAGVRARTIAPADCRVAVGDRVRLSIAPERVAVIS